MKVIELIKQLQSGDLINSDVVIINIEDEMEYKITSVENSKQRTIIEIGRKED